MKVFEVDYNEYKISAGDISWCNKKMIKELPSTSWSDLLGQNLDYLNRNCFQKVLINGVLYSVVGTNGRKGLKQNIYIVQDKSAIVL